MILYIYHQGPCHTYVHKRGQTAGWTDVYCQHCFKVGSKLLSGQETVADPFSIINSLKKIPVVHICGKQQYCRCYQVLLNQTFADDSCTYVRYSLAQTDSPEQKLAFENLKGCFEPPSLTNEPDSDIDCPDVAPLTFSQCNVNREAMNDPNKLVHPDSTSLVKYCLGTRIQMRKGKPSHKLNTCQFHDVNKSKQGKFLRTMTQEAMNVSFFL